METSSVYQTAQTHTHTIPNVDQYVWLLLQGILGFDNTLLVFTVFLVCSFSFEGLSFEAFLDEEIVFPTQDYSWNRFPSSTFTAEFKYFNNLIAATHSNDSF